LEKPPLIDTIAIVERNDRFTAGACHYGRLRLQLDQPIPVLPGQFAMLKPRGLMEPLLRRAMAYYRGERGARGLSVEFIYQVLGRGTRALAALHPGDEVDFLGSLGNTFDLSAMEGREALLVAGGVGSAALYMLAEELQRRHIPVRLFIGGAGRGDLCGLEDFISLLSAENVIGATVDGSYGEPGFVTLPLEKYLRAPRRPAPVIFACGPEAMLHRVSQIAAEHDAPAQLSLEAPMACGFGICVGCAVAVKADCPEGFVYKKVCTDGPVFRSDELHWP
jgi:dihydroorotate dehydrogenase electron transfer subunit